MRIFGWRSCGPARLPQIHGPRGRHILRPHHRPRSPLPAARATTSRRSSGALWLFGQCNVFVRNAEQLSNPPLRLRRSTLLRGRAGGHHRLPSATAASQGFRAPRGRNGCCCGRRPPRRPRAGASRHFSPDLPPLAPFRPEEVSNGCSSSVDGLKNTERGNRAIQFRIPVRFRGKVRQGGRGRPRQRRLRLWSGRLREPPPPPPANRAGRSRQRRRHADGAQTILALLTEFIRKELEGQKKPADASGDGKPDDGSGDSAVTDCNGGGNPPHQDSSALPSRRALRSRCRSSRRRQPPRCRSQ